MPVRLSSVQKLRSKAKLPPLEAMPRASCLLIASLLSVLGCSTDANEPKGNAEVEPGAATQPLFVPTGPGVAGALPRNDGAASASALAAAERRPELPQADQARRRGDVDTHILNSHRAAGHRIVATETLGNGTVVDWVDRSTVAGAGKANPEPLPSMAPPPGTKMAEVLTPVGPPGTVPFYRPTFSPFVKGLSPAQTLDDYIRDLAPGHPSEGTGANANRLYVSSSTAVTNFGANAFANMAWQGIDVPTGNDFGFIEIAAYCRTPGFDLVGPIVGHMPAVYAGGPVFGVERFTSTGSPATAWSTAASPAGFVQTHPSWAPGVNIVGGSTVGGAQGENWFGVSYYDANILGQGFPNAWWVFLNGQFIGYYPATLFRAGFSTNGACRADFYGEMLDVSSSTTDWMNADMGSGRRPVASSASLNLGQVGYARLPVIATIRNNMGALFPTTNSALLGINHEYCYDGRWTTDAGSNWNPTLWLGGPGGNGVGCNADPGGDYGYQPQAGAYVCSAGCTQCGGSGCSQAGTQPGDVCCTAAITNSGVDCDQDFAPCKIKTADPECRTGVLHATGSHCCAAGCTQCGGPGCNAAAGCCTGTINSSGKLCSSSMPPCKVDPPPAVP